MARAADPVAARWAARPVLGAALRLLALLGPIAIGLAVALMLARFVPAPAGGLALVGWWVLVLGGSSLAVFGTDRLARRLLPLAILLELSLLFPDRAPSRLRAARTASVRDLDARLARLRSHGGSMEPYEAAETVVTLVGILGLHDKRTRGHSERVRAFTDLLTAELGLNDDDRMRLRWAALVHDLGKLSVPSAMLNSKGGLDAEAWELMHRHPDEGVRLLAGLLPWMGEWGDAVAQHHERFDGTGYPRGLAGEDIAYGARIVALADSFEVMTSARSYKASRSAAWARTELTRCAGTQFDPALVRAFLGISIGRLRWVLGPVTWLAELPFVATVDRAGQSVKVASVTALAAALVGIGGVPDLTPAVPLPPGTETVASSEGDGSSTSPRATGGRDEWLATSPLVPELTVAQPPVPGQLPSSPGAASSGTSAGVTALSGATRSSADANPAGATTAPPSTSTTGGRTSATTGGSEPTREAAAPQPHPQPQPQDPGPALAPAYHLTSKGLQRTPSSVQEVLTVPIGSTRRFDARLDRPVVLPAERDLLLYVRFPTKQGSAKVAVRLLGCSSAGCSVLSSGLVTQDKSSIDGFEPHVIALNRGSTSVERLPAGSVLRVEVQFLEPGAKAPGRVALGSSSTPSRLRLPQR